MTKREKAVEVVKKFAWRTAVTKALPIGRTAKALAATGLSKTMQIAVKEVYEPGSSGKKLEDLLSPKGMSKIAGEAFTKDIVAEFTTDSLIAALIPFGFAKGAAKAAEAGYNTYLLGMQMITVFEENYGESS